MRSRVTRRTLPLIVAGAGSVALMLAAWALWLEPSSLRIVVNI